MTANTGTAPQATPAGYAKAIALFRAGEITAARDLLQRCVAQAPAHVGARYGLGVCWVKLGDHALAEELLREVVSRDPLHVLAHLELGGLYAALGRHTDALAAYRAVLSIEPTQADAVRRIAELTSAPQPTVTEPAPRPKTRTAGPTLAAELDADATEPGAHIGGEVIVRPGNRALWSHRRLWLGMALLIYLPVGVLAQRRLEELLAGSPGGVPDAGQTLLGLVTVLFELLGYSLLVIGIALIVGAILSSRLTTYVIRAHRIEISRGVLFRSRRYTWFYSIRDLEYVRDPLLLLAGTAKIKLVLDEPAPSPAFKRRSPPAIVGFRDAAHMRRLFEQLETIVRTERRAMKKAFI